MTTQQLNNSTAQQPQGSNGKLLLFLVVIVVMLATILRIVFFTTSITSVPVSSDEALATLTAKRILRGHLPLLVLANQYQFPVDAYALVPFVNALPRNAFGARVMPFIMGLLTTAAYLVLLFRMAKPRTAWPALLLIMFPSAYLLMHFCAYAIPQHSTFMLLSALALLACAFQRQAQSRSRLWAVLAGFSGGLATANHLLALPVLATTAVFVCLGTSRKDASRHAPMFLVGALIGLAPYFLAHLLVPGAYSSVTRTTSLLDAMRKLWNPTLTTTLPRSFGVEPCVFPDGHNTLGLTPSLQIPFGLGWITLLVLLTGCCLPAFIKRLKIDRWPSVTLNDVFVGISWLCLGLFIFNQLSFSHCYRYLLPLVWCFPFMVGYLYAKTRGILRMGVAAATCGLVLFNLVTTVALVQAWKAENFAARQTNIVDLAPALQRLDELKITHCYASYWAAYRINFETDERILCSQPINERFPGWYTPYKNEVDHATNVAYVLTEGIKYLKPRKHFDRHLRLMNVSAEREPCGEFILYRNFMDNDPIPLIQRVPLPLASVTASHNLPGVDSLKDKDPHTRWSSESPQEKGMWVEAALPNIMTVHKVRLSFQGGNFNTDQAGAMQISAHGPNGWQPVFSGPTDRLDKFQMLKGHPVYGHSIQTLSIDAIRCDAIRLELTQPGSRHPWIISEIDILGIPHGGTTRQSRQQ